MIRLFPNHPRVRITRGEKSWGWNFQGDEESWSESIQGVNNQGMNHPWGWNIPGLFFHYFRVNEPEVIISGVNNLRTVLVQCMDIMRSYSHNLGKMGVKIWITPLFPVTKVFPWNYTQGGFELGKLPFSHLLTKIQLTIPLRNCLSWVPLPHPPV